MEDVEDNGLLSQLPNDDFGTVRERRFSSPMDITRTPILPSPFRDHSFSPLTGFRYYPTANPHDRLSIKVEGVPSTSMIIPDAWNDRKVDHSRAIESTRRQLEKLEALERYKRRKVIGEDTTALPDFAFNLNLSPGETTSAVPAEHIEPTIEKPMTNKKVGPPLDGQTRTTVASTCSDTITTTDTRSVEQIADHPRLSRKVVPKQELYFLYGKKPFKVQLSGSDYLTWDNGKAGPDIRYTSAFVCPVTNEIFLSARYIDTPRDQHDGLNWYTKKTFAEHAAAAIAWDCWHLREGRHPKESMSLDSPYFESDEPYLPVSHFPAAIQEKVKAIQIKREKWKQRETERKAEAARTATSLEYDDPSRNRYGGRTTHSGGREPNLGRGMFMRTSQGRHDQFNNSNRGYRDNDRGYRSSNRDGYGQHPYSYHDRSQYHSPSNIEGNYQIQDYSVPWGVPSNNSLDAWTQQQRSEGPQSYGRNVEGYHDRFDQARSYNRPGDQNDALERETYEDKIEQPPKR